MAPGHPVVGRLGEQVHDRHRVSLRGSFDADDAGAVWTGLRRETAGLGRGDAVEVDLSHVTGIDGRTLALILDVRDELAARGVTTELTGARAHVRELIELHAGDAAPRARRRRRRPESFLAEVGRRTLEVVVEARNVLGFFGAVLRAAAGVVAAPRTGNWRQVLPTMERTGADAVPIVLLVNFLVGFVLAYQASSQLHQVGADRYVAHLVGLSMTREMAPLMTAIIVCGRSGAGFAAELGTMKVGEEIDALRTMGFSPVRYLVLPRMLALVLVMPILTLLADAIGVFGGYAAAAHTLDLSGLTYLRGLRDALDGWDVLTGVIKSVAFGVAIALIACQQGFATSGGAEGVGRRTTASVVTILFVLILLDTGFTVLFKAFAV